MLHNKRVFVSGGAGVIGQELIPKLVDCGAVVLVGDLKPRPRHFAPLVQYRQGDLNYLTFEELNAFAPDIFIHLAATFERSTESYAFWEENFWHNVRLSHHLATLTKDMDSVKRVINASSYLIYDPELYSFAEPQTAPYSLKETDPIYPRNLTGMAKLAHEIELRFLQQFNSDKKSYVNARIYRGYGKGSRCVISRWIRALLAGEEIAVYRKEGIFDYIYAGDTADGLIQLAMHANINGTINLGTGKARPVSDVVAVLKASFPDLKYTEHEADIPYEASQADITMFKNLTGWAPPTRLEDAIPQIIEHERSYVSENISRKSVMITSVSRKVSMAEAIKRGAGKTGLFSKVVGADANKNCIGRHFTDDFWEMPRLTDLSIPQLIHYCRENEIGAIIPSRDQELQFFADAKEQLSAAGIYTMVSSAETIQTCLDKYLFYEKLHTKGFSAIPAYLNPEAAAAGRWVVKERFGAGSAGLAIDVSLEEALSFASRLQNPIYQPFIAGKEYSIDCYVSASGKTKGVVCRTRDLVVNGESQITTTLAHPKMEQLAITLLEAFGFYGHIIFQVIESEDGGLHIIECNPRFGGASSLSVAVGLDSFYWFLLEAAGVNVDDYPFGRLSQQKKQIRAVSDTVINA
jgi:carbamoyl-phosphate synthase large subunit